MKPTTRAVVLASQSLLCAAALAGCMERERDNDPGNASQNDEPRTEVMDAAGPATALSCADGPSVSIRFLGPETLELTADGETHILLRQRTASGARYAADGVDFWNKGEASMLTLGSEQYHCSSN
jgi:membrane-bound inhibitor of C-type lysozyme